MKSKSIEIIIATTNKHKFSEIKEILSETLKDITFLFLGDLQEVEKPEENGKTFLENALIKAKYYFYKLNKPVISEDSGLEVEDLNNEPGVLSARYAGPNSSQKDLIDKLLKNLENKTNRNARFVCSAVFMYGKEKYVYSEGIVKGKIATEPKGTDGFGYDPVFIPEGYDKTFSELGPEIKNQISHRSIAFINLAKEIKKILNQKY